MRRQWDRCPPLPIAVQRVGVHFGMKTPRIPAAAMPRQMDGGALARLQQFLPMAPAQAVPQPIDFEEFRSRHG